MASTVIPISLQASPVPASLQVTTLTQLMQLVAQYVTGSVAADVTFFQQGSVLPTTDQGVIFYNTVTGLFYFWSVALGAYVPTGLNIPLGSVIFDYVNGDELSNGYVQALGSRVIDSIAALSANQNANAHILFGAGALIEIPNITSPVSTVGGGGGGGGTLYPKIFVGF